MQFLTKRNLLLGNVVLVLIFLAVAYAACRPLWRGGVKVETAGPVAVETTGPDTVQAQIDEYKNKKDDYPRVIEGNNIFIAKVEKPPERRAEKPLEPLKEPPWILVNIWEPTPGVFEATISDRQDPRRPKELVVVKGDRFPQYQVEITEVTEDYVRYEIRDDATGRVIERFLPPSAASTAGPLEKDWSSIITKSGARRDGYDVDMNRFEAEFQKLAGEGGDWVEALIKTVEAEPYKPGGADAPLRGYKVLAFRPNSPLDEFGVEPQDVIVGLVREPITSEAHARELLREALQRDEVTLHINRLGNAVYFNISLKRF
jgi:hypothetical protein